MGQARSSATFPGPGHRTRGGRPELIDVSGFERIDPNLPGEKGDLAREARAYLLAHEWCGGVREVYLAEEYGATVLLSEVDPLSPDADSQVWVITGDAPIAYMDVESCPNAVAALCEYVICVFIWADDTLNGAEAGDRIQLHGHNSFRPLAGRTDAEALQPFIFGMAKALLERTDVPVTNPSAIEPLQDIVRATKQRLDRVYRNR